MPGPLLSGEGEVWVEALAARGEDGEAPGAWAHAEGRRAEGSAGKGQGAPLPPSPLLRVIFKGGGPGPLWRA